MSQKSASEVHSTSVDQVSRVSGVAQSPDVVRFAHFEVDLRKEELRRSGRRIRLPGQSFQVLRMLLRRSGALVTREELQHELWPADSFGDFEHGLNAAVNRLREALGDSAENPEYVQTVPRRGYRFIAVLDSDGSSAPEIRLINQLAPELASPPLLDLRQQTTPQPTSAEEEPAFAAKNVFAGARRRRMLAFLLLPLLASGILFYFLWSGRRSNNDSAEALTASLLTTLSGSEIEPSFSPDGSQVVFAWDGGKSHDPEPFDLYVKVIGTENVQRLTHDNAGWIAPAWSPDGRSIAFVRHTRSNSGVFLIPARGGPERKLASGEDIEIPFSDSLSWSPDGRSIAYSFIWEMFIVNVETGSVRKLKNPARCENTISPVFSPDGATIAFYCDNSQPTVDIYTMPADGGPAKYLTNLQTLPNIYTKSGALAWSTDGKRLIYPSKGDLYEISRDGGKPRRLNFAQDATNPVVSARGQRLVYVKNYYSVNLWKVSATDRDRTGTPSRSIMTPTSSANRAPDIAPDGKRIAFESWRSGLPEIWVSNSDGGDAVQLTNFHAASSGPRWSPDGRQIAFASNVTGKFGIYLVEPSTALPRKLPMGDMESSEPSWSHDGKWIYFGGPCPGPKPPDRIEPMPCPYRVASGGGTPVLISQSDGMYVQESKDGKLLYFCGEDGKVRVKAGLDGEEHAVGGMPEVRFATNWVLTPNGIYFIAWQPHANRIDFFDFASRKVTRHIPLEKEPPVMGGLALSPDGKWLAYAQIDENESDLMLVEGFR